MAAQCSGEMLVATAAIIAIQLSQGRSALELNTLSNFFDAISNNLVLISQQLPLSTAVQVPGTSNRTATNDATESKRI